MNVLIVYSVNHGFVTPFIRDQIESLGRLGIVINTLGIKGKGSIGYLRNYRKYKSYIESYEPHVVHAHFGLSGLFANLQRSVPVVTTYHGSDINNSKTRLISLISILLSRHNVFVSERLRKLTLKRRSSIIPCGVDLEVFKPINKEEARRKLGFSKDRKYVLFSSSFTNPVKNYPLAQHAIELLRENMDVELLELKNYSRNEVSLLMNAADAALMTSFSEGSPQFIKEAMACNLPCVSTDVGDVREMFGGMKGGYISDYSPKMVADSLISAFQLEIEVDLRSRVLELDSAVIARKILLVYKAIMNKPNGKYT